EIVKNVSKREDIYFSDFKAGEDKRYDIDIGKLNNGVYKPSKNLDKNIRTLFNSKLLNLKEYTQIMDILRSNKRDSESYDIINEIIRLRKVIRWTEKEILAGNKKLAANKSYTLKQGLLDKTVVKLDTIANVNNNFF